MRSSFIIIFECTSLQIVLVESPSSERIYPPDEFVLYEIETGTLLDEIYGLVVRLFTF